MYVGTYKLLYLSIICYFLLKMIVNDAFINDFSYNYIEVTIIKLFENNYTYTCR